MRTTKARDVMTRKLITVNPGLDLQELAALFDKKGISGAPVVDDEGVVVGVVSKTDIVRARAQGENLVDIFYRTSGGMVGGDSVLDDEYSPYSDTDWSDIDSSSLSEVRVADVMNRNVYTVEADETVQEVAAQMLSKRVHRVLVLEDGAFVGIVSTTDLMRALAGIETGKPAKSGAKRATRPHA